MTITDKRVLLLASGIRKTGKTTFGRKVLETFTPQHKIAAVKFVTARPGMLDGKPFHITEQTAAENNDTGFFLQSGAKKAFLVHAKENCAARAWQALAAQLEGFNLIVCEASRLRFVLKPAAMIYFGDVQGQNIKPEATTLCAQADLHIQSALPKELPLTIRQGQWHITAP